MLKESGRFDTIGALFRHPLQLRNTLWALPHRNPGSRDNMITCAASHLRFSGNNAARRRLECAATYQA